MVDSSTCICYSSRGRGIFVVFWMHIGVHVTAPYEGSLLFLQTDIGEDVGGRNVGGGKICCRCGAMGQGSGNTAGVDFAGLGRIGERTFEGEGVFI